MLDLAWKLNRLRTMGAPELAFRSARWMSQKLEKRRVYAGQFPLPAQPVRPGIGLFPVLEGWQRVFDEHVQLQRSAFDEQMEGKFSFFGGRPVHFGSPIDWHVDPTTGKSAGTAFGKEIDYRDENVVGNVKLVWELGRHQHLIPYAVAYARTGEVRLRCFVVEQIESWIESNPYGRGIHWCSALELALRLVSWACVHSLIALTDGSEGLFASVTDRKKFGEAIYQHASFIRNHLSRFSSANNHLIGELVGLWTACNVFDLGRAGGRWKVFVSEALEKESRRQVHADGVNKEQAIYYHLWVLEYFLFADLIARRAGLAFSNEFHTVIERMADFLRAVTPEGGKPPQIGDSDDGFVTRFEVDWPDDPFADVLLAERAIRERSSELLNSSQKAFWYALSAGQLVEVRGDAMGRNRRVYPRMFSDGGYAVLGGDDVHLIVDGGPLGYQSIAAHGHADALSICLAVDGVWWLVDPGTFAYHTEPEWRSYFRGSNAHSTITVDGTDQSQMGGPFLWTRHARACFTEVPAEFDQRVCGTHDGYSERGVIHSRCVIYSPETRIVTIKDELQGKGTHEFCIHFHFAPWVELDRDETERVWHLRRAHNEARLTLEGDPRWKWETFKGSESPRLGWYSARLGHIEPSPTLRGRLTSDAPVKLVTRIEVHNFAGKPSG